MSKIIIKESHLVKLIETAMDLDRYAQEIHYDSSNGNESIEGTVNGTIAKLKELLVMFKYGKKTSSDSESNLYSILDKINDLYDDIKYQK